MTQRIVDLARRLGTRTYRRVFRRDLERDFQRLDHSDTALRSAMEMEQKMRCASALLAIPGLHERVTPPVLKAGDWLHEELFVFGSGASLLDLYFAMTSGSGTWSLEEMQGWHRGAGLAIERPIRLRRAPLAALAVARKR